MWFPVLAVTSLARLACGEDQWWRDAVYYRILVDSLKTAMATDWEISTISYSRALGADAVILSPLSEMSSDCSKPGVTNLTNIDERYGNLGAITQLLDKTRKLELKALISLPVQTISTASDWCKSSADKVNGFENTLIWEDGSADNVPPVMDGIEAWVWNVDRSAYFATRKNEAILNLCSESVAAYLASAQCAWIRRGFLGILLNPDFVVDTRCGVKLLQKLVAEAISCARSSGLDTPVILVETTFSPQESAVYYSDGGVGAHSVLSAALAAPTKRAAAQIAIAFHEALLNAPQDSAPTWITSAPYESRIATRYGNDNVDGINLLALILPGAAVIQQGDELGVADTILEWASQTPKCWPYPAVPSSAPFPWSAAENGGFTDGEPWLPLSPNYRYANAKTEFGNNNSHIGVLRIAAAMRKSPAMGPHMEIKRIGDTIAILRWGGLGSLLVVVNLGQTQGEMKLSAIYGLPSEVTVAVSSAGSGLSTGSHIAVDKTLKLAPGEALLLAGGPRHCGGPGPVDKIANKLSEGWQKINKYFSNI
ncbi:hypothetical protein ACJJTC_018970 [Scirpophaga incertulas]